MMVPCASTMISSTTTISFHVELQQLRLQLWFRVLPLRLRLRLQLWSQQQLQYCTSTTTLLWVIEHWHVSSSVEVFSSWPITLLLSMSACSCLQCFASVVIEIVFASIQFQWLRSWRCCKHVLACYVIHAFSLGDALALLWLTIAVHSLCIGLLCVWSVI